MFNTRGDGRSMGIGDRFSSASERSFSPASSLASESSPFERDQIRLVDYPLTVRFGRL